MTSIVPSDSTIFFAISESDSFPVKIIPVSLTIVPSSNLTFSPDTGGVHFLFPSVVGGVNNSSTFSIGLLSFGSIPNCATCFDGSLAIALL